MPQTNKDKSAKAKNDKKKLIFWGISLSLAGLVVIFITIIIEQYLSDYGASQGKQISFLAMAFLKLFENLGGALIILGLVSIITDFNEWREYFQKRLAETVVRRDYLKTLDDRALIDLQTDTLKAFFKADDIDRKGSFLEYFYEKIRDYIGSPYREDSNVTMDVKFTGSEDTLLIDETITYKCKKVGKYIQDDIQWFYGENDVIDVSDYYLEVEIPKNIYQSEDFKSRYPEITEQKTSFKSKDKVMKKIDSKYGFEFSLKKYKEIDGLKIKIKAKYIIDKHTYLTWRWTRPCNRIKIVIIYPKELKIWTEIFGIDNDELDEQKEDKYYSLTYDSWMLPFSGFTFQLRPKKLDSESGKPPELNPAAAFIETNLQKEEAREAS